MANRLARETSPYLLQHADNPVDWYPWGEEAFRRARKENRPVLVSIGYSACHWCHVMEHESFEDPETAKLMNELFVNVKVDREERPDVDQVYMKAVQAITGGGGWPLTVFCTPDGVPYYGGTYFPPSPRHGLPSFRQVLEAAASAYYRKPDEVLEAASRLRHALAAAQSGDAAEQAETDAPGLELVDAAVAALDRAFDSVYGGFGGAPKFPQPMTVELLLRHHVRTGDGRSLEMAVRTLECMAGGGIRDHLAGGFHRYSVDAAWQVPHFEKMLYDNALLARAYLDAYRVTGDAELRRVAEETLEFLLRDLQAPEGGFYSAFDADSEGVEGLYYLWTAREVDALLDAETALLFRRVYGVDEGGNFEGRTILSRVSAPEEVARELGVDAAEARRRLEAARRTLLEARQTRTPPLRDEKILTSWSALATRALAEAGAALGRDHFVDAARAAGEFHWAASRPQGRLQHVWTAGVARVPAFLEDVAALGHAYLSLHGATLEARWLQRAEALIDEMLERFRDDAGRFWDTARDAEPLYLRPLDPMDHATPSGTSLAAELLVRGAAVFSRPELMEPAESIFKRYAAPARRFPTAFGHLLSALDRARAPSVEIVILAPEGADPGPLVRAAHRRFLRAGTVAGHTGAGMPPALPLLEGRAPAGGRATAFVCRDFTCRLPVPDPDALLEELSALSA